MMHLTPFALSIGLAVVFSLFGLAAPLLDRKSSHRFSLAILGVLFGLMALIANMAIETHENFENSNFMRQNIGSLMDLPSETQREFISEYGANAKTIEKLQNPFLRRQSAALENDFQGKYGKLASGTIEVPTNRLMVMAMDLTREAKGEIIATSLFSVDWKDKWGGDYWQLQKDQMKKGVKLRRIFILNGQSMAQCEPVFREHANAGVDVLYIDAERLSPDENKDLIVIDRSLAAELIFTTNNEIVGGKVIADPKQVQGYGELVENIAVKAEPYRASSASR